MLFVYRHLHAVGGRRSPEVLAWTFMRDMDGGQPLRLQPRHLDTDQVSLDIIDQRRLFRLK